MDDVRKELVEEHRARKPRLEKVGHHKTKRRRTEEALREKSRLKQLLLDTLPHPAMLIRKDRTVLAANRVAREVGAKVGGYCWRDFGQSDFIPEKHKKYINDHKKVPPGGTHCHFCLADEALRNQERTGNAEIHAWGKIWDAHWIPLDDEVYLHYAIDVTECKRAQEALRDSEEKYRAIFEQAADSIVLVDAETGELVEFNDKAHENLGYTREEFQKLKIPDFEIIKSAEEVTKHIKKIVGERADTFETKHRTKDGQIRDVLVSSKAISIGGKDLCQGVWHDITEHKKAEGALRVHGQVMTNMAEGVYLIRQSDRVIVYTNPKFEQMFGYDPGELIGEHVSIVNARADKSPQDAAKGIIETLNKEGTWSGEICNVKKDGTPFWCYANVSIFEHPQHGKVWVSMHTDITDRKRAEAALRESEERYRRLVSTTTDAVMLFDAETRKFVEVNKACEQLYGYSRDEFLNMKHDDITAEPEKTERSVRQLLKGKLSRIPVCYHKKKDGTVFPVEISTSTFELAGRTVACGVIRDITERKAALAQIENLAKFPSEDPYPVLRIAKDGTVLYTNKAGSPLLDTWQSTIGEALSSYWREFVLVALRSGQVQQAECECGDRVFSVSFAPVIDADYVNVYGLDITERKRAELELFRRQAQLKSLASQLTLAEEHERHRIATDLHDTVSQSLVISKLKLEELGALGASAKVGKAVEDVCNLLNETIQETKRLISGLSPRTLRLLGFEEAVQHWLSEQIQQRHGIACEFEDDGQPKPLSNDIRVLLFRNVRELLINVVRHAQAQKVKVSVRKVGSEIHVAVEDNGRGFDPAAERDEFGLFSIRERLEEMGGHLEIESAPGQGCRATMMAPLE